MRQQHKSPVKELSLLPVREDQSPVRVTSKAGKKWQGESNASEKRRKITPSEKVFNQYASQTDGYDSEFERESQSVQSLSFVKIQNIDNVKWSPPVYMKKWLTLFAVISLLASLKPLQRKYRKMFLLPGNCPL